MNKLILVASVGSFFGACGGDDPVHQGTINTTGARTSVESVSDVFAALDRGDGTDAAGAVVALTAAGQIVVTPSAREQQSLPALAELVPAWPSRKSSSAFTGTATCDSNGCVFDHFGDSYAGSTYEINGSIRHEGDLLAFDLTYDITGSGLQFHWEMDGRVRVNASQIDGEVHSHGDADITNEGRSYDVSWDFDIDYNNIGLVDGCPVSGSLSATVGYAVSGNGQAGNYRARGSVSFGPACGQFQSN